MSWDTGKCIASARQGCARLVTSPLLIAFLSTARHNRPHLCQRAPGLARQQPLRVHHCGAPARRSKALARLRRERHAVRRYFGYFKRAGRAKAGGELP
jgi:hypothetical protein